MEGASSSSSFPFIQRHDDSYSKNMSSVTVFDERVVVVLAKCFDVKGLQSEHCACSLARLGAPRRVMLSVVSYLTRQRIRSILHEQTTMAGGDRPGAISLCAGSKILGQSQVLQ